MEQTPRDFWKYASRIPLDVLLAHAAPGRRRNQLSDKPPGLCLSARPMRQVAASDLALEATLKTAAPYRKIRGGKRLKITRRDLMRKVREKRTGHAILFLLDASASMRSRGRMVQVKGLIRSLLEEIYACRDRVAMAAFRHDRARLFLPFTHNLTRALEGLDRLEVGGKTPLADGLVLALKVLLQERFRDPETVPVLLVFSDGKPNLSLGEQDPLEESLALAERLRSNRIHSVFIDTEPDPLAFGYGPDIAHSLGGLYVNMSQLVS